MNKPTDEQIKEFWERCGGIYRGVTNSATYGLVYAPRPTWWFPAGGSHEDKHHKLTYLHYDEYFGLLPIDLNNLFRYAVPTVVKKYGLAVVRISLLGAMFRAIKEDDDVADALFWATYKIIQEAHND